MLKGVLLLKKNFVIADSHVTKTKEEGEGDGDGEKNAAKHNLSFKGRG